MLTLILSQLPETLHGPNDLDYRGKVPMRARFLHPEAAASLLEIEASTPGLVYTDIFRSAEASLLAIRTKRGVQRPGYSAHNYGLAFDLDVTATLRRLGLRYPELTALLGKHGWYCHRRDLDATGSEAWHFNFLGPEASSLLTLAELDDHHTWSHPVDAKINELYGHAFKLDFRGAQLCLAKAGLYRGGIDGVFGALSNEALAAFQRAWFINEKGLGLISQRTLAYVTSSNEVASSPPAGPKTLT